MKKIVLLLDVLLCVLLIFSSCNVEKGNLNGVSDNTDAENTDEIIIKTVSPFGGTDPTRGDYQEAIRRFELKYPNVTVMDDSSNSDEEWKTKINADFACKNNSDVIFYFTGVDSSMIVEKNFIVSVDEIRTVYPNFAIHIKDDAFKQTVHSDGKNYAIPIRGFWEGLFINTDIFEEYGVKIPTDYASFLEAVTAFAATDIVPVSLSLPEEPHYWIEQLILSAGTVEDHSSIPKSMDEVPQSWIDGLNTFKMLYDMGAFSKDMFVEKNISSRDMFVEKKSAMRLDGSWFVGEVKYPDTTTIIPFYKMDGSKKVEAIAGYSMGFFISRDAWDDESKRKAVCDFVEFMISHENISLFSRYSGMPAVDGIEITPTNSLVETGYDYVKKFDNTALPIDYRLSKEAWVYLTTNIGSILNGSKETEEVLSKVVELESYY